uniref:Uncharacterized protein n=1 Tax=Kalanchoe fedtschenkoi TaxID=63787 RepID=A0A7N0UC25_KALFE
MKIPEMVNFRFTMGHVYNLWLHESLETSSLLHPPTLHSSQLRLDHDVILMQASLLGNHVLSVGADLSFDIATGNFTQINTGLSLAHVDLIASLALNDKADLLNDSYYHTVSPLSNTTVGAEFTHRFSTNENTFTIGTQHALDLLTTRRPESTIREKLSFFTVSGEVDTKAIEKSAKVGLALALKP